MKKNAHCWQVNSLWSNKHSMDKSKFCEQVQNFWIGPRYIDKSTLIIQNWLFSTRYYVDMLPLENHVCGHFIYHVCPLLCQSPFWFWFISSFGWFPDEWRLIYSLIITKLFNISGNGIKMYTSENKQISQTVSLWPELIKLNCWEYGVFDC